MQDTPDSHDGAADWSAKAADWHIQVGEVGDRNRLLSSDPVLWRLLGDVHDMDILDAGCGTGYLSRELRRRGARVTGVDVAPGMIEIAEQLSAEQGLDFPFHIASCSDMPVIPDQSVDRLVSNYVLMDLPDLDGAVAEFYRVLRPGGVAVLVFSHPCFPSGHIQERPDGRAAYHWPWDYYEPQKRVDPPWNHFRTGFVWYHRPLSVYMTAFRRAGFMIDEMDEPHLTPDRAHLAQSEREAHKAATRPYSIAFRLIRP